jgi:RNA polymerase sigma factor (sigma-70 family)
MLNEKEFSKSKLVISNDECLRNLSEYRLTGDVKFRNKIIDGNLRLLLYLALRSSQGQFPVSDLFQEAIIGFAEGIEKYDESKANGAKVSSYAYYFARKYVLAYIERNQSIVFFTRKPLRLRAKIKKGLKDAVNDLQIDEAYIPIELIVNSKMERSEMIGAIELSYDIVSLSETPKDGDVSIEETIGDRSEQVSALDNKADLMAILDGLNAQAKRIILAKFEVSDEDYKEVLLHYHLSLKQGDAYVSELILHLRKNIF